MLRILAVPAVEYIIVGFMHNMCVITRNEACSSEYGKGGGIYNTGDLTITNCTICNNKADSNSQLQHRIGGGIDNSKGGNVYLYNIIVASNRSKASGSKRDIFGSNVYAYNTLSSYSSWSGPSSDNIVYDASKPLLSGYMLADNSQTIDMGNNQYRGL